MRHSLLICVLLSNVASAQPAPPSTPPVPATSPRAPPPPSPPPPPSSSTPSSTAPLGEGALAFSSFHVVVPPDLKPTQVSLQQPRADLFALCSDGRVAPLPSALHQVEVANEDWGPQQAWVAESPCGEVAALLTGPGIKAGRATPLKDHAAGKNRRRYGKDIVELTRRSSPDTHEGVVCALVGPTRVEVIGTGGECDVVFADDLNGDGRVDVVFQVRTEMCMAMALYASTPTGWRRAAFDDVLCPD